MKRLFIFFLMFGFWQDVFSAIIGSDSSVTRFNSQQTLNDGDVVAAFAALQGGFALSSQATQAEIRTFFPVTGDIEFNGGTLVLGRDLILKEVADIKSLGTIFGNGHVLDLSATTSCIPSGESASCEIRFLTSAAQVNEVLTVDWSFDDSIIAIGLDASGGAHDTVLTYLFDGTSVTFADSDQPGAFTDVRVVRWHPTERLLAVGKQGGPGGGDDLYTYSVDVSGNLTQIDSDNVAVINAVAWHPPSGAYLATGGFANVAEIRLYPVDSGGDLDIANRLDVNIAPNINVEKEALDWDITGSYLAAGFNNSGAAANFRIFEFNDQPSLSLIENATDVITGNDVECVSWHPTCSSIIAIATDDTTENVRIYNHDGALGTLTQVFDLDLPEPVRCLHWSPDGSCLAVGTDVGTGNELITYSFDKDSFALTLVEGFDFSDDVESVRWSHDGDNLAVGNNDDTLYVYETLLDDCFTLSQINIVLTCDVELKDCCLLFVGDTTIRGRGKCLTLAPTCTLIIDSESTLLMKDITVKGIQDFNLQLFDNSSTLSLQNVTWLLDDDFTFTNGHFDVLKDFHVMGEDKKLIYQSEVQSTIQACGKMILDDGVTFSYDPVTDSHDLLQLVEESSEIILRGATLHSTSTGLRLTTGNLRVEQASFIASEGSVESEAVAFGDGVNSTNDLTVIIEPAARLELIQGCLIFADS